MKQYKKMKNSKRVEKPQDVPMKEENQKLFLSELEKEKLQELQKEKEKLEQLHKRIGELKTHLTLTENEAVQLTVNCANNEQKTIAELQQKYGQFQIGENYEVIKNPPTI